MPVFDKYALITLFFQKILWFVATFKIGLVCCWISGRVGHSLVLKRKIALKKKKTIREKKKEKKRERGEVVKESNNITSPKKKKEGEKSIA